MTESSSSCAPTTSAMVDEGLEILTPAECWWLLASERVGRVVVTKAALPAVFPVNYIVRGSGILFLTGAGSKLRAAVDGSRVGFEVDHMDLVAESGWSVLGIGPVAEIHDQVEVAAAKDAGLRSGAGGERSHLIRMSPEFLSGRRLV